MCIVIQILLILNGIFYIIILIATVACFCFFTTGEVAFQLFRIFLAYPVPSTMDIFKPSGHIIREWYGMLRYMYSSATWENAGT